MNSLAFDNSAAYRALRQKINDQGIETDDAGALPVLDLGSGVSLSVVTDGDTGSVLRLEWGKFSLVLAPGETATTETTLVNDGLAQAATALLLGDSGSSKSNGADWIAAVNPRLALVSVGAGNALRNPAPQVLAGLVGRDVLRTDQHGAIAVETDGEMLWVQASR